MAVVGSWMLVAMVVTMGYSSTLVSLLAARNIPQPINSLRDLVDSDSIVVMKPKTAFTDFFEVSILHALLINDLGMYSLSTKIAITANINPFRAVRHQITFRPRTVMF